MCVYSHVVSLFTCYVTIITGVTQELIEDTRLQTEKVMLDDLKIQVSIRVCVSAGVCVLVCMCVCVLVCVCVCVCIIYACIYHQYKESG